MRESTQAGTETHLLSERGWPSPDQEEGGKGLKLLITLCEKAKTKCTSVQNAKGPVNFWVLVWRGSPPLDPAEDTHKFWGPSERGNVLALRFLRNKLL